TALRRRRLVGDHLPNTHSLAGLSSLPACRHFSKIIFAEFHERSLFVGRCDAADHDQRRQAENALHGSSSSWLGMKQSRTLSMPNPSPRESLSNAPWTVSFPR